MLARLDSNEILSMAVDTDDDLVIERDVEVEPSEPETEKPPMYKVVLLNDDYTPMEFVVHVLESIFNIETDKAIQLMLAVHTLGQATVAIYPREVAETKSEQLNMYAKENDHPLLSRIEAVD